MAQQVSMGATIKCSFGATPGQLTVVPQSKVFAGPVPAATIMDHSVTNILPFGLCSAPTNPAVIAKSGSPAPCVPVTTSPWVPGSPTVKIGNQPALTSTCKLYCQWLGEITIVNPGQQTVKTA